MDNRKDDNYYLNKIVKDLSFIIGHASGVSKAELKANEVLLDSVMFRLIQISENAARLTEEFKRKYSEVPWQAIKGMRNRIVHDYGEVDLTIVFDTVAQDIPKLYEVLSQLI